MFFKTARIDSTLLEQDEKVMGTANGTGKSFEYRHQIQAAMTRNSRALVFPISVDGRKCWVKHRPNSKKNNWHRLQALFAFLSGMSLFKPTVSSGGTRSLRQEAQRLNLLGSHGISVPEVIVLEDDFLITDDRGVQLQDWIEALDNIEDRLYWLKKAVSLLIRPGFQGAVSLSGD